MKVKAKRKRGIERVYHADPETHRQVHEWCDRNGIKVKVWVDGLLKNAMARGVIYPEATFGESTGRGFEVEKIEITDPSRRNLAAILKKPKLEIAEEAIQEDEPWAKRPFWEGNRTKKVDSDE
jgi:hypothetical protein